MALLVMESGAWTFREACLGGRMACAVARFREFNNVRGLPPQNASVQAVRPCPCVARNATLRHSTTHKADPQSGETEMDAERL